MDHDEIGEDETYVGYFNVDSKMIVHIDSFRLLTLWNSQYEFLLTADPIMVVIDNIGQLGGVDNMKVKVQNIQLFDLSDEGVNNMKIIEP
jgi:hypothetical protein